MARSHNVGVLPCHVRVRQRRLARAKAPGLSSLGGGSARRGSLRKNAEATRYRAVISIATRRPVFEPLYDIDLRTGTIVEVFYADRGLAHWCGARGPAGFCGEQKEQIADETVRAPVGARA
jgi:hypothetical protein